MQSRSLLAMGRRMLRSRPGLRLGLAVLSTIAVVEAAILMPATRLLQPDRLARLGAEAPDPTTVLAVLGGVVLLISTLVAATTMLVLRRDLLHDRLTGLPNRQQLAAQLDRALAGSSHRSEQRFALLLLRIDRLKVVHDSLGPGAADQLLLVLAERLRRTLAAGDMLARAGDDQLAVLMAGVDGESQAQTQARRLQAQLAEPVLIDAQEIHPSASMGLTFSWLGYLRAEGMIQDAAIALESFRGPGRGDLVTFDLSMRAGSRQLLRLESDLRRALERGGQLRLHYQPVIALDHGGIAGFEALVRWQHPERGLVPPADFVPLAEESGLILPLGRWVMDEALRQLEVWQRQPAGADLFVGINLSSRQLLEPGLIDHLRAALADRRVDPGSIQLQVTEALLMQDLDAAAEALRELERLRITLAIDDFGTGHSSLALLKRFPFDVLEIDHSFVRALADGDASVQIVRTIVDLARALGLQVVAEGAETPQEVRVLRRLGCDMVQGYVFSPPVAAEEATRLLAAHPAPPRRERRPARSATATIERPEPLAVLPAAS